MMSAKTLQPLENVGSLITQGDQCLGYLIHVPEHGTFEPSLGKVDVSAEEAEIHNQCLDKALIEELDNCELGQWGGQWGTLYWRQIDGRRDEVEIRTFLGIVVAYGMHNGKTIRFTRDGKVFRGLSQKAGCFNFKRIA